jgi:rubrerythrin
MKTTFPCRVCGLGHFETDWIDSGTVIVCSDCQTETIIDLWSPEERETFFTKAARGGYVEKGKEILHTCPECNNSFHA